MTELKSDRRWEGRYNDLHAWMDINATPPYLGREGVEVRNFLSLRYDWTRYPMFEKRRLLQSVAPLTPWAEGAVLLREVGFD